MKIPFISLSRIRFYLLTTTTLQLFLFLLSFPVLLLWGIPISVVVLFSTPLFAPFLTIFLGISALIFFCLLFSLPYSFLLFILNYIVLIWDFLLRCASSSWLYGFAVPPDSFLFVFVLINTIFLLYALRFALQKRLLMLSLYSLLLFVCLLLYGVIPRKRYVLFQDARGRTAHAILKNRTIIIIDKGILGNIRSPESWIRYSYIPFCIKQVGHQVISFIVVQKMTKKTIMFLQELIEQCHVRHIVFPDVTDDNIKNSEPFLSFIDKATLSCVTLTPVKNRYILCTEEDTQVYCCYDAKEKCLTAWGNEYETKENPIYYRI